MRGNICLGKENLFGVEAENFFLGGGRENFFGGERTFFLLGDFFLR